MIAGCGVLAWAALNGLCASNDSHGFMWLRVGTFIAAGSATFIAVLATRIIQSQKEVERLEKECPNFRQPSNATFYCHGCHGDVELTVYGKKPTK